MSGEDKATNQGCTDAINRVSTELTSQVSEEAITLTEMMTILDCQYGGARSFIKVNSIRLLFKKGLYSFYSHADFQRAVDDKKVVRNRDRSRFNKRELDSTLAQQFLSTRRVP
jgi:hypothetical protein